MRKRWFLKVGDRVRDKNRNKITTVSHVERSLLGALYLCDDVWLWRSEIEYIGREGEARAVEHKPRIEEANDEFTAYACRQYSTGFGDIPQGTQVKARLKEGGEAFVVKYHNMESHMYTSTFWAYFALEPQEAAEDTGWFELVAKADLVSGLYKGDVVKARRVGADKAQIIYGNQQSAEVSDQFMRDHFEHKPPAIKEPEHDIDAYARTLQELREEREQMGAELYGYPPELDWDAHDAERREEVMRKERAYAQEQERVRQLERESAKLRQELATVKTQAETQRQQKVMDEYGIFAERYVWTVVIHVPYSVKSFLTNGAGRNTVEVVTENKNAVEAAMAAEAMAKKISAKCEVLRIEYERSLYAIE